MKLLLTSAGISNKTIENALQELVAKPLADTLVAFIPTASNPVEGDKWWMVKDIATLSNLGCKIDFVDISALPKETYLARLSQADVVFVEGGDTFYLMDSIHKSGGYEEFRETIKSKVYVGVSAGSAICSRDLALEASQVMYDEAIDRKEDIQGLDMISYYVFPHFGNREWFPKVTKENAEKFVSSCGDEIYLIDDQSAIVVNGATRVVSEGVWEKIPSNKQVS